MIAATTRRTHREHGASGSRKRVQFPLTWHDLTGNILTSNDAASCANAEELPSEVQGRDPVQHQIGDLGAVVVHHHRVAVAADAMGRQV